MSYELESICHCGLDLQSPANLGIPRQARDDSL